MTKQEEASWEALFGILKHGQEPRRQPARDQVETDHRCSQPPLSTKPICPAWSVFKRTIWKKRAEALGAFEPFKGSFELEGSEGSGIRDPHFGMLRSPRG